uniref:Uncharacterized protein n=1 Tax=Glossina pallidipes TaxID=7398 RepID=A0A1A9ZC03_GLOPL
MLLLSVEFKVQVHHCDAAFTKIPSLEKRFCIIYYTHCAIDHTIFGRKLDQIFNAPEINMSPYINNGLANLDIIPSQYLQHFAGGSSESAITGMVDRAGPHGKVIGRYLSKSDELHHLPQLVHVLNILNNFIY